MSYLRSRIVGTELSVREVSRRTGVPVNTLRAMLNDDRTLGLGNLIALAAGMGWSMDQLFGPTAPERLRKDDSESGEPGGNVA